MVEPNVEQSNVEEKEKQTTSNTEKIEDMVEVAEEKVEVNPRKRPLEISESEKQVKKRRLYFIQNLVEYENNNNI